MIATASQLGRFAVCSAAAVLPRADEVTEATSLGIFVHRYLQRCSEAGREVALAEMDRDDYRQFCESIDLDRLEVRPDSCVAELAVALDLDTGKVRELGRGVGRAVYRGLSGNVIAGTIDFVALTPTLAIVGDYKVGRGSDHYAPPPAHNWQLRFAALCVARLFDRQEALAQRVRITHDGRAFTDSAHFDAFELDTVLHELRELAGRIANARRLRDEGREPPATTGMHCRYCKSFAFCPAQTALVHAIARDPVDSVEREVMAQLTPETAARAWERLKLYDAVAERVRRAIYAFAQQQPIPLPSGAVLGPVETHREYLDGKVVREVLRELATPEIADAACEYESSKAAVQRAVRPLAEAWGQPLKAVVDKVLGEVRRRGGAQMKSTVSVREYAPKEKEEAA